MKLSEIKFLYFITHIDNIPSILEKGILSHNKIRAQRIKPTQIDNPKVQEKRENKILPNKTRLHDYANTYFNPRNAMMYCRIDWHRELSVIKIDPKILNTTNAMITDRNASSDYVRFYSRKEIDNLNAEFIFSRDWRHPNPIEYFKRKSYVCAEVLIPNLVPPSLIRGIYVSCEESYKRLIQLLNGHAICDNVCINSDMFFR